MPKKQPGFNQALKFVKDHSNISECIFNKKKSQFTIVNENTSMTFIGMTEEDCALILNRVVIAPGSLFYEVLNRMQKEDFIIFRKAQLHW